MIPKIKINGNTPLDLALTLGSNPQSLSEKSLATTLRPSAILDNSFLFLDPNIQTALCQTALSIYSLFYLKVVAAQLGIKDGVTVEQLLGPLSTQPTLHPSISVALEAIGSTDIPLADFDLEASEKADDISKPSNLAVGKILSVPIDLEGKAKPIPVTVQLMPNVVDAKFLRDLIVYGGKDKSVVARTHQWLSGEIDAADYFFMLDLLREEKRLLIKDSDNGGLFEMAKMRRATGGVATAISGKEHPNVASSIIMITETTAREIERGLRGRLSNPKTRHAIFVELAATLLFVIDPVKERFRLYTRGFEDVGYYRFADIKDANTNTNSMDMDVVMTALRHGKAPNL